MPSPVRLSLLSLFVSLVSSQNFTLTSNGCIDPSGFDSCYSSVNGIAQQCYNNNCNGVTCTGPNDCTANNDNCVTACLAIAYQGWINCGMTHCWNRAYSCEFQSLEIQAFQALDFLLKLDTPPYFFPPTGAAGACSCTLSGVFAQVYQAGSQYNQCAASSTNLATANVCTCCGASMALSSIPDVCPTTNPNDPGLNFLSQMSNYVGAVKVFQQASYCASTADPSSGECTNAPYNFNIDGATFYGPDTLPSGGTDSISDTAGTLTAPLSATIVWSLVAGNPPATAIAVTKGSGSGSGSGVTTTAVSGGTATSTPAASGSGAKSGAAAGLPDACGYLVSVIMLFIAVVLFI